MLTQTTATHDGARWFYEVRILALRDFNGDGHPDVAACFTDQARNGGTYRTREPLLLQLVDGRAIAVAFEIDTAKEADECGGTMPSN